jgi:hypothetical protein
MPAWATDGLPYSGIPRNVADWTDFCTRSVQRYKTSIRAWGFWNEPNLSGSWSGTRQQFIDIILKPGADAVHAANPDTIVAGPDLAHLESGGALWYSWLADIIQQMGGRLDVVTHHAYSTWGSAGVTARTFNNGDPTKGTFGLSVPPTSVTGGVSSQASPAASVLIGLKQNADAYTNLGLVNLNNDWPKIQLDFLDGLTVAPLASKVIDMKPYQSLQLNRALLDAGYTGTIDLYTVKVTILQGTAVYPYATVIDVNSTDPIGVTPTEAPSNAYRFRASSA